MLDAQVRPSFTQDLYLAAAPVWGDGKNPEVCAVGYGDFVSRTGFVWDTAQNDDAWRLYWIEAGEGFVQTDDGKRQWLRAGDFFAMVPHRAYHREDQKSNPWRYRLLMLRGTRVEEALRLVGLTPNEGHQRPGLVEKLEPVFLKMRTELLRENPPLSMLCALAHECLAGCAPEDTGKGFAARRGDRRDALAVEWLRQHYARGVTVEEAAKAMGISRSGLFRAFHRQTGQNPKNYLDHLRVEHARRLLTMGGYTLKEIAARSGFTDTQHFARTFTRKTGAPPRELMDGAGKG
jgi:AraC-like DNA-binding protein